MSWTREQEQTINSKDRTILVSAAAGSGKTATLVERIIKKVTDEENPVDIDSFLVVTFTKAAAAQMREKIAKAIEERLEERPDSSHLIKQMTLIHQSDITTIDSFCLKIVKENFSKLEIDSVFSIADSAALSLLENDAMDKMYEKHYEMAFSKGNLQEEKVFLDFIDMFSGRDNSKDESRNVLFSILKVADSYSNPEQWINDGKAIYDFTNEEEFQESQWLNHWINDNKEGLRYAISTFEKVLKECLDNNIEHANCNKCALDLAKFKKILEANNYTDIIESCDIKAERMGSVKEDNENVILLKSLKRERDGCKSIVDEIKKKIISLPLNEFYNQTKETGHIVKYMLDLCLEFRELAYKEKLKKKMFSFSDISHFALKLLYEGRDDNNCIISTPLAKEVAERYVEIYIDEYQDSNFLQEDILMSIAGHNCNKNNIFMVGDVKQSIYGFRMARPDLFTDKYNNFSKKVDGFGEICIELNKNFRSRSNVLESVNDIFKQIMQEKFGGVDYSDNVELKSGLVFEDTQSNIAASTELLIIGTKSHNSEEDKDLDGDDSSDDNSSNSQLEAIVVADKINEIVNGDDPLFIWDKNSYRPVRYGDIVILGRKIKNFGDAFYYELINRGIPAYVENPEGYFDATEIRVMVSLLSIVDNSYQDIELGAVLLSPIGNLTESDLVAIEGNDFIKVQHQSSLYDKCLNYCMDGDDSEIIDKLNKFFEILEILKTEKNIISVSRLIKTALDITKYNLFIMAMPMGKRRIANMLMLIEKAENFEKGQFKGLFNFLRYVEGLKVNQSDFGEANIIGEDENLVRIMTMHKSKGLEFPVVFVSGLGGEFNMEYVKNEVVIHNDYFVTANHFDVQSKIIKESLMRDIFLELKRMEQKAEEQRLLYVAMTRAKEKMYLTGTTANIFNLIKKYKDIIWCNEKSIPISFVSNVNCPLEWIIQSLIRTKNFYNDINTVKPELDSDGEIKRSCYYEFSDGYEISTKGNWSTRYYPLEEVLEISKHSFDDKTNNYIDIKNQLNNCLDKSQDEVIGIASGIRENLDYRYAFQNVTEIQNKMSISDIKKAKMFNGENYDDNILVENIILEKNIEIKNNKPIPVFLKGQEEAVDGASKGTAIHKIMELLDFVDAKDLVSVSKQITKMFKKGYIDASFLSVVNPSDIFKMVKSSLGQRMVKAEEDNLLFKEQQFIRGISADEIDEEYNTKEKVLVQGIIDAFFYENDKTGIVLMDYKTDRVNEQKLIDMYKSQLDYYATTIEQLTGVKVIDKIIYSFYLQKEIEIG